MVQDLIASDSDDDDYDITFDAVSTFLSLGCLSLSLVVSQMLSISLFIQPSIHPFIHPSTDRPLTIPLFLCSASMAW